MGRVDEGAHQIMQDIVGLGLRLSLAAALLHALGAPPGWGERLVVVGRQVGGVHVPRAHDARQPRTHAAVPRLRAGGGGTCH